MAKKPFSYQMACDFMPALRQQVGAGVDPKTFTILSYSSPAKLGPRLKRLEGGGWIEVLDRSGSVSEKPAFGELVQPDVLFIEYLPEYEAQLLAEVARCQAARVDFVVVATAIKTPPGEAVRQLERLHERYELCDFYIYLINERGNLESLYNELLREMSVR